MRSTYAAIILLAATTLPARSEDAASMSYADAFAQVLSAQRNAAEEQLARVAAQLTMSNSDKANLETKVKNLTAEVADLKKKISDRDAEQSPPEAPK